MRIIVLLLLSGTIWAGGSDTELENELTNSVAGSNYRALALSNALGDVDIAQCIVTKQKGNVIWSWQGYEYNVDCLADRLDRGGRFEEAATLRCQAIPVLAMIVWPNGQTCVQAMTLIVPEPPTSLEPATDPMIESAVQQMAEQKEEYESLEQRVARVERNNQIAARKAQERREFAQQTIEKVMENDPEE